MLLVVIFDLPSISALSVNWLLFTWFNVPCGLCILVKDVELGILNMLFLLFFGVVSKSVPLLSLLMLGHIPGQLFIEWRQAVIDEFLKSLSLITSSCSLRRNLVHSWLGRLWH